MICHFIKPLSKPKMTKVWRIETKMKKISIKFDKKVILIAKYMLIHSLINQSRRIKKICINSAHQKLGPY